MFSSKEKRWPSNRSKDLLSSPVSFQSAIQRSKVLVVPNNTPFEMAMFQLNGVPKESTESDEQYDFQARDFYE